MSLTPKMSWPIVEECFDEAEFLWAARERALDAHNQNMEHVRSWTEERLLGSLEGLSTAGDAVIEMLTPALEHGPAPRASVAAFVLATLNSKAAADVLVRILPESPDLLAIRQGLELAACDLFQQRLQSVADQSPRVLALLTDVRAFQGVDAQNRLHLLWATDDDDVRAATVRLARSSPKDVASTVALTALQLENPEIRTAAMELGLMTGVQAAWTAAVDIVDQHLPGFGRAALAVATLGGPGETDMLLPAFALADWRRDALFAAGAAGTVVAADACLAAMKNDFLPRVAGESFCTITGLDLEAQRMVVPEPPLPDEPIPFEADDLDEDLIPKADEMLPMPDVAALERWWAQNRKRFPVHERFVAGRPCSPASLHDRLANGPMRRRFAWAFEVAARTQGKHQIQTRAFMATQQAQLARLGENLRVIKYRKEQWSRQRTGYAAAREP